MTAGAAAGRRDWDAIVVGLGALGSAAAWALAAAGARVLGLEQFRLGHDRGASHDHARIIRRSYHTPGYVRLAGLAYRAWADLEREAGERLLLLRHAPGSARFAGRWSVQSNRPRIRHTWPG